jgi:hypothetical protein
VGGRLRLTGAAECLGYHRLQDLPVLLRIGIGHGGIAQRGMRHIHRARGSYFSGLRDRACRRLGRRSGDGGGNNCRDAEVSRGVAGATTCSGWALRGGVAVIGVEPAESERSRKTSQSPAPTSAMRSAPRTARVFEEEAMEEMKANDQGAGAGDTSSVLGFTPR